MDRDGLRRLDALYRVALERQPSERDAFVSAACAGDLKLRRELQSLLKSECAESGGLPASETARPLACGAALGPYRILELIGRGGMGEVYRAQDTRLDRIVAIKLLRPGSEHRQKWRQPLRREARATAALNHPHICSLYDIGEQDGTDYLVMEYVEGETLARRLLRGPLPLEQVLEFGAQVADALRMAHGHGIIHRDLKPGNLMLTGGGIKILDFGVAKFDRRIRSGSSVETLTLTRGIIGTVPYMAPEQLEGKECDARSDIFTLGLVLYEMATGKKAFQADSPAEVISRTLHSEPDPVSTGPPQFQHAVQRCLKRDPALRWQSAADLKLELEELAAAAGRPFALADAQRSGPPHTKPETGRNFKRAPWWALAIAVAGVLALATMAASRFFANSPATIRSIAVLPFVHANNSPEIEYLSDGISESLINTLSQLPHVKVIARSSSFSFRGRETDIRQVARSLGVQALVTGRVVQSGGRLKVTAELVNGADGTEIWGEQYQRGSADVLAVQAEISREIADRLHATFPGEEQLARRTGTKAEAYELLLRGRYQLRLYTPDSIKKAVEYYQQAIAVDAGYALAHAELAYNYRLLSGSAILNPADMLPKAEAEALKALALDEGLAEAHSALADVERDLWHWTTAGREYRRALELNSNLADAHDGYAIYLSVTGKHDEAIAEILRTRQLDPLKLLVALDVGTVYYNARDFRQALDALRHALELDPASPTTQTWVGIVNGGMGRFDEALAAYEKAISKGAGTPTTRCLYAYSLARSGKQNRALEILEQLRRSSEFVPPAALAFIYAGLNQKDEAFRTLERAYEARDPLLQYLNVEPHYDVLRSDQRFHALLTKVGLPH